MSTPPRILVHAPAFLAGLPDAAALAAPDGTVVCANERLTALACGSPEALLSVAGLPAALRSGRDTSLSLQLAGSPFDAHVSRVEGLALVILRPSSAAARRDLVARAAHELRTPVTAISGAAQTLLGDHFRLDPLARGFVEILGRAADSLARLADDLVLLSRCETGELTLEPFGQDLATAAAGAVAQVRPRTDERRISLSADQEPGLRVNADWRATQQLLAALLEHAVRRSPERGCVTLSARRADGFVRIEVKDDGPRLDARQLARPFEPFQGGGVLLALADRLARIQGGTAGAESDAAGTRLWVTLPAA